MNWHQQGAHRTSAWGRTAFLRRRSGSRGFSGKLGLGLASVTGMIILAATAVTAILAIVEPPRNTLWMVIRTCVMMKESFGTPLPCLTVKPGSQGFAILRAPGSRTHLVVTPVVPLSGLESPALWSSATAYWRAAMEARPLVVEGARTGPIPIGDVALAVNARRSRSQDHLHIHADCAAPELLRVVRSCEATIGPDWTLLPEPIEDARYWARRVGPNSADALDIFSSLRRLPNGMKRENITIGSVGVSADNDGDLVQLVSDDAASGAEDLLATACEPGPAEGQENEPNPASVGMYPKTK